MSAKRTARPAPRSAGSGPNGKVIAVAVGLVVVVAAIAALALAGSDSGSGSDDVVMDDYGVVQTAGAPLPALGDEPDPAVGQQAPAITSERPDGTVEVDPGGAGTARMLVFLAHWCPHCQAELPHYVELAEQGAFDDIETVAVLTSTSPDRPNFPPSAWLDREGWTGARFHDDRSSTAAAAYGVSSFPFTVFVDADGNVTERFSGAQPTERILAAVEGVTSSPASSSG